MKNSLLLIIGLVLIVLGIAAQGQPWTTPEMLKGLGFDVSKIITNVGLFMMFMPIIRSFFFAPLKEAMDSRNAELESTFVEAETLRSEMVSMKADYEKRLAETEASAREQIQEQVKQAQELGNRLRAEAAAQIEEMKKSASDEMARERDKAIAELRLHVVNLSLGATEKLLAESVDNEKNRKLVDEFISQVEVKI